MKQILIAPIKLYQKYISPLSAPRCKYYPSCSTYTELAIAEFGLKGLLMGIYRFVRCNPLSHGGVGYPSKNAEIKVRERQTI